MDEASSRKGIRRRDYAFAFLYVGYLSFFEGQSGTKRLPICPQRVICSKGLGNLYEIRYEIRNEERQVNALKGSKLYEQSR